MDVDQTFTVSSSLDFWTHRERKYEIFVTGEDFMHEVYKKLGEKEPLDQLEFAEWVGDTFLRI